MKLILPVVLGLALVLIGCGGVREDGWGTFPSENQGEVRVIDQVRMPNVRHLVTPDRAQILSHASVIFFYDPDAKFGGLVFKHRSRWYASGGFIGNVNEFIHDEARIHRGVVVFVTPTDRPFNNAGIGPRIAYSITRGDLSDWDFYYVEKERFGDPPDHRQYFDENDKKIIYPDY